MGPGFALFVVGAGAFIVWYSTRPGVGGFAGLFAPSTGTTGSGTTTRPFLTEAQFNYYLAGFSQHITSAQAAAIGAQAGTSLAKLTFGISIGIGALIGWVTSIGSNDTREDRETLAKRLGFRQLGQEVDTNSTVTTRDGRESLYGYLNFISEQTGNDIGWKLVHEGLNIIGRKDYQGNVEWCVRVLVVLWLFEFQFPR